MKEEILESRYKDVKTVFTPIDDSKGVITTNSQYTRTSTDVDGKYIIFVDFEGGPMINIGKEIQGKKIKSIKHSYLIEFE